MNHLLNKDLFNLQKNYILGLSGGADSVSLFHLLLEAKINFKAIHFNHNLRISSKKDEQFCEKLCQQFNIKLDIIQLKFNKNKNIESQARQKRLNFYQNHHCYSIIILAHHQADCRENFLIRLLRGSNSSGLTGIREQKTIKRVTYIRPLLNQEPEVLKNYLKQKELTWCEDETNQQSHYLRNNLRNQILPNLIKLRGFKGINQSLNFCQEDAQLLEDLAYQKWKKLPQTQESYKTLPLSLFARILLLCYKEINYDNLLKQTTILRAYKEIHTKHQQSIKIILKKNFFMFIYQSGIISFSNQLKDNNIYCWDWQNKKTITISKHQFNLTENNLIFEKFDIKQITSNLKIRFWKNGDTMIPLGKKSKKKIKDIFINAKIPLIQRTEIPLLLHNNEIIWIPQVARSNFALISKNSINICISYQKLS